MSQVSGIEIQRFHSLRYVLLSTLLVVCPPVMAGRRVVRDSAWKYELIGFCFDNYERL